MSDTEFNRLFNLQMNLLHALRQVKDARRAYPDGIENMLTIKQLEKMKLIEDRVTEEMDA